MHHCSAWMLIEWVQFRQSVSNYSYIVFISTPIRSSSQCRSLPLSVSNLVRSQLDWWKDDGRQWKQFNKLWWLMRHPGWLEERMLAVQMQLLAILNMISNSLYSSKVYSFLCRHLLSVPSSGILCINNLSPFGGYFKHSTSSSLLKVSRSCWDFWYNQSATYFCWNYALNCLNYPF